MCWEVTGKSTAKENVEPTAYLNPIDVEYRLLQLIIAPLATSNHLGINCGALKNAVSECSQATA